MKAMVFNEYGNPDVLRLKEVKKPVPKDNEVMVKVYATTVTSADCRLRASTAPTGFWFLMRLAFGIFGPRKKVLGTELSGEIVSIGKGVSRFKNGDQVFAMTGAGLGGYSEFICLPEDGALTTIPASLSLEESAAISFGGTTALYFLRDLAKVEPGQKVLINGASGCIGTYAVQLAKVFGADVTGVCSTRNVALVEELGAHQVVDYTKEDFTQNGETYDVILDTVGNLSFSQCKKSMKPKGKLLLVVAGLPQFLQMLWLALFSRKKVLGGVTPERAEDLVTLRELIDAGSIKPVISRTYRFEEMAEAHRYVDTGHKKGNVVVTLNHPA